MTLLRSSWNWLQSSVRRERWLLQCSSIPKVSSQKSFTSILHIQTCVFAAMGQVWLQNGDADEVKSNIGLVEKEACGCCKGTVMRLMFFFFFYNRVAAALQAFSLLLFRSYLANWLLPPRNLLFAAFGTILSACCYEFFLFFVFLLYFGLVWYSAALCFAIKAERVE